MEPIEVQPYMYDEAGNMLFSPAFQTAPYECIGLLVEKSNRSVVLMLRNERQQTPIPCIFLQEKAIAQTIVGLQQALATLRQLPVE
jgi:hypothetical protein